MDMLATTHANRRGIYLWSNQLIFGSGVGLRPSEEPVRLRLPELQSGAADGEVRGGDGEVEIEAEERDTGAGVSSSDEDSDDEVIKVNMELVPLIFHIYASRPCRVSLEKLLQIPKS